MTRKMRDTIIILSLIAFFGLVLIIFNMLMNQQSVSKAYVYYDVYDPLVTVDFEKQEVSIDEASKIQYQERLKTNEYPVIDLEKKHIILLGEYQINGVYQLMIIRYHFQNRTMEIIREESPNNICSREGVSKGKPLICLPNNIRIEFDDSDFDFIQ